LLLGKSSLWGQSGDFGLGALSYSGGIPDVVDTVLCYNSLCPLRKVWSAGFEKGREGFRKEAVLCQVEDAKEKTSGLDL
jgi:hypothetical protein